MPQQGKHEILLQTSGKNITLLNETISNMLHLVIYIFKNIAITKHKG